MTSDDEIDAVVAVRIADMPTPACPSVRRRCRDCQAQVWVAYSTFTAAGPTTPILCVPCALALVERDEAS